MIVLSARLGQKSYIWLFWLLAISKYSLTSKQVQNFSHIFVAHITTVRTLFTDICNVHYKLWQV